MKKYITLILIGVLSFLGVSLTANAATPPKTFVARDVIKMKEYISGISQYYKPIDGGIAVFCEDEGYTYLTGLTYGLWGQVDQGYIYIVESNPGTGDAYLDYYIKGVAVWWYKDILTNSNNNITAERKNYIRSIRNSNSIAAKIMQLVEGAQNYKQNKGAISFPTANVTFTESNGNYISNLIAVKSDSLISFAGVKLEGAPAGTKIINSNITSTGNGNFQISIPKSSIIAGQSVTFRIRADGKYRIKKMYEYYIEYNHVFKKPYQHILYPVVYYDDLDVIVNRSITITRPQNSLSITKVDETNKALAGAGLTLYKGDCSKSTCLSANQYMTWTSETTAKKFTNIPLGVYTLVETKTPAGYLTAEKKIINIDSDSKNYSVNMIDVKAHNSLSILKVNHKSYPLKGAVLTLYKGDCTKSTCSSTNQYSSWTTGDTAKVFNDIPLGVYTLVETKTPAGYLTADKMLINVNNNNAAFSYTMIDQKELKVRISKTAITGGPEIPGASLVLKDASGKVVESWISTTAPHYTVLKANVEYSLTETIAPDGYVLSTDTIKFKLDEDANVYKKNEKGEFVKVNYIEMINEPLVGVNISKTAITGGPEIPGASLVLKDASGKVVDSWISTTTPHNISLEKDVVYTLTETIAPKGYFLSTDTITFKVDKDANIYEKTETGEFVKVDRVEMINDPKVSVRISKTDITGDIEIPGASLVLKDASGKVVDSWVSKTEPHYSVLRPDVVYELTETIAPKGFILSKSTIYFKVDRNSKVYEKNASGEFVSVDYIKMINLQMDAINISKLDLDTNEYVVGANLIIKDYKGEVVANWTTEKESHYVSLEEGEYILSEVKAPDGYVLNNEPIYFKIDAYGNLFIMDSKEEYVSANGIIFYNEHEADEIVVPATGVSSTLTYVMGIGILGFGSMMLYKNEKEY